MADGSSESENGVYVYKAPQQPPPAPMSNETGEIVGAIVACIVILAVLLFLWKMAERKRKEMSVFQDDPEEGSSDEEKTLPNSPKLESTSPKRSFFPGLRTTRKKQEQNSFQQAEEQTLPNAVSPDEVRKDTELDRQLEELVLPNLSPITSMAWSHRGEACSGDTGYNSGFCRKETVLRRRQKHSCFDDIELDLEHPRDTVYSLKRDNEVIREEMNHRSEKNKKAIAGIGECLRFLSTIREKVESCRKEKRKECEEIKEFLRHTRESRRKFEVKRIYYLNCCFIQQQTRDQRDAFLSMQDWFDGMRLRPEMRHIAEEVFLLRSMHRSAFERNEVERKLVKDSLKQVEKCEGDISRIKSIVIAMRKQIEATRRGTEAFHSGKQEEELSPEPAPKVNEKGGFKLRIKLPRLRDKQALSGGREIPEKQLGERCATCRQHVCKCPPAGGSCFTTVNEDLAHCSKDVGKILVASTPKVAQPDGTRTKAQGHPVTLRLHEITTKGGRDDGGPELSEREVRKALNRVPFVTTIKSMAKMIDGSEWTLEVVSAQQRLANVRFNCRGRTYVIGMTDDSEL